MTAKKDPEKKPRTPKIVEEPDPEPTVIVTHQGDKNGAANTCVEGVSTADDNTAVEIHVDGKVYGGGTTINGRFRAVIPFTESEITVIINGEAV